MAVLGLLAGLLLGAGVYLILASAPWRRLVALALIGQGLPLLIIAAGAGSSQAITIAVALELVAFALFLAAAAFVRQASRAAAQRDRSGAQ
jgi:multisubunit Na+/H+ antiporter MnhC subunit